MSTKADPNLKSTAVNPSQCMPRRATESQDDKERWEAIQVALENVFDWVSAEVCSHFGMLHIEY